MCLEDRKLGILGGTATGKVKTAEGASNTRAEVRDTPQPFISSVRRALAGRTRELERLAVELYVRFVDADIEVCVYRPDGSKASVAGAVSEITERLWAEYEDFCKRDLSEHAVVYLFVDESPSGFGQASGVRLCWLPGASARTDAKSSWG